MAKTILTRPGWCEECSKKERPRINDQFIVMGSRGWHMYIAEFNRPPGFTPHLYKLVKVIGENVVYEYLCCMHNCGCDIYYDQQKQGYQFQLHDSQWKRGILPIKDWNALQQYFDSDYWI